MNTPSAPIEISALTRRGRGLGGALAWIGLGLVGIGAWLLFPREIASELTRPGVRACLVDASASATRRRTGWNIFVRKTLREEAIRARDSGDEFLVFRYAGQSTRAFGPGSADEFLERLESASGFRPGVESGEDEASNLTLALRSVSAWVRGADRPTGSLTVVGERTFTGADPMTVLGELAQAGVQVSWVDLVDADQPDAAVDAVFLPPGNAVGAPLSCRVDVALAPATGSDPLAGRELEISLELSASEGAGRREELRTTPPASSVVDEDGVLRWPVFFELGPTRRGITEVRATASIVDRTTQQRGDRVAENDSAVTRTESGDDLTCVVVAHARSFPAARTFFDGTAPGVLFTYVEPEQLAAVTSSFDLCVTFDVGLRELPGRLLGSCVERGSGWLACGGWGLLSDFLPDPAALPDGAAQSYLPLTPDADDLPERDVVFLIDGSGSMAGSPFASVKNALFELVPSVLPRDDLYLRFFTAALNTELVLSVGSERVETTRLKRLETLLGAEVPGGQTAVVGSLEQLAKERVGREREALVLLLTDGQETNGFDEKARTSAVLERFRSSNTRLRVIAVGDDPDLELLSLLVEAGDELIRLTDYADLTDVFQRQVNDDRVRTERQAVQVVPATTLAEGSLGRDLARALKSVEFPTIERVTRARPATENASIVLRSAGGEPLLGVQRVGLGATAMLCTGPDPDWAPEWRARGDLIAPLLRALGANAKDRRRPTIEEQGGDVILEGADPGWPAVLVARFRLPRDVARPEPGIAMEELGEILLAAPLLSSGDDLREIRRGKLAPFLDGIEPGTPLLVDLVSTNGTGLATVAFIGPRAAEFREPAARISDEGLARLGKSFAASPSETGDSPHPSAAGFLLAGLIALTVSAFLRR